MHRPAALLLLAACSPVQPDESDVVSRTDLSDHGVLVGVTVEPDTGRRLALVSDRLVDLDGNPLPIQPPAMAWTDVAAIGDGVVALSTRSDGYLFETTTGLLTQHFCYEPGFEEEWDDEFQITFALGFDLDANLLVAQPQSAFDDAPDSPTASFVATYDAATGTSLDWYTMPAASYRAGGLAPRGGETWLATGSRLDRHDATLARPEAFAHLRSVGITDAQGLAIDEAAGTVLVADAGGEIVEIRLEALE